MRFDFFAGVIPSLAQFGSDRGGVDLGGRTLLGARSFAPPGKRLRPASESENCRAAPMLNSPADYFAAWCKPCSRAQRSSGGQFVDHGIGASLFREVDAFDVCLRGLAALHVKVVETRWP